MPAAVISRVPKSAFLWIPATLQSVQPLTLLQEFGQINCEKIFLRTWFNSAVKKNKKWAQTFWTLSLRTQLSHLLSFASFLYCFLFFFTTCCYFDLLCYTVILLLCYAVILAALKEALTFSVIVAISLKSATLSFKNLFSRNHLAFWAEVAPMQMAAVLSTIVAMPGQTCHCVHRHLKMADGLFPKHFPCIFIAFSMHFYWKFDQNSLRHGILLDYRHIDTIKPIRT